MQPTPSKKTRVQVKRSTRSETPQEAPPPEVDPSLVSSTGDLVLSVKRSSDEGLSTPTQTGPKDDLQPSFLYRVQSKRLQDASPYFARLLDPARFGEGAAAAEEHTRLLARYPSLDVVPFEELPVVHISDVGRISPSVKSIHNLLGDFLRALHDEDLSVRLPPIANIANLAVVADRFDALAAVRQYFRTRKLMAALDAKGNAPTKGPEKSTKSLSEERVRQKLLAGLLLDNAAWVWHASLRLIHRGWVGREPGENAALWWDLPMGIEEELLFRRDCILDTIQSVQTYFLDLYTSKDRQCKNDPSPECDIFQLGQMIKFFKRINTLSLQGSIITTSDPPDPYEGEVFDLVDTLRQAPEYQVDKSHSHCGLRARIMPLLDFVSFSLNQEVGVCLHCWQECRHEYAWSRSKRPLVWKHGSAGAGMVQQYKARQAQNHLSKHLDARDLFMANERIWTT